MDNLFHYNEQFCEWERVDRVQEYKGVKIETLTTHGDYSNAPRHREYRVTYPDGRISYVPINKRQGCNIRDLKDFIDYESK